MIERAWADGNRNTLVCVDAYENGVIKGKFYNPFVDVVQPFENLTQFLKSMEQTLDTMDFPRGFHTIRTFSPLPPDLKGLPGLICTAGEKATFSIRVMFRQNASWQGSITWLEGKQEQTFRSVLELVLLMSTALEQPIAS